MDEWKKEIVRKAITFYKQEIDNFLKHTENGLTVKDVANPHIIKLCEKEKKTCNELEQHVIEAQTLALGSWKHPPFVKILSKSLNMYYKSLKDGMENIESQFGLPFGDTNASLQIDIQNLEHLLSELPSEEMIKDILKSAK